MLNFETHGRTGDPAVIFGASAAGDLDMRHANIWKSAGRDIPRVTTETATRGSDVMKLVCFGPSLSETWEKLKDGEGDIWTISGANAYLYQRGISAHFHLEADPRAHKAKLLEGSSPETIYFIASRCSEEVFNILDGKRGCMYHVYSDDEKAILDMAFPGEFRVPPAWSMGITALNIGLLLGYRKFLIWAMDGSYKEGKQHPAEHPNEETNYQTYTVDGGREFLSSPTHMVSAECMIKVIEKWPYGTFEFIGDGMIPYIYRQYTKDYA